jgi:hypothetical protein
MGKGLIRGGIHNTSNQNRCFGAKLYDYISDAPMFIDLHQGFSALTVRVEAKSSMRIAIVLLSAIKSVSPGYQPLYGEFPMLIGKSSRGWSNDHVFPFGKDGHLRNWLSVSVYHAAGNLPVGGDIILGR